MKYVWNTWASWWRTLVVMLAAFVIAVWSIRAGVAQPKPALGCGSFSVVDELLRQDFAEKPVWRGLDEYRRLVVLYEGPNGNWTIVVAMPSGYTCAVGVGNGGDSIAG